MNKDSDSSTTPPSLRRSRAAPVIERAPLPMIEVAGPEHLVCFVNSAFCQLLERTREELMDKPFAEIVSNGDRCVPILDRVYETGQFETHAMSDESESGRSFWLYAMWPALDANEKPDRVIVQLTRAPHFRKDAAEMNEALLIAGIRQHELRDAAEQANVQLKVEVAERERAERALLEAQTKLRHHADTLEETVDERTTMLRTSIGELEAFSYSLVHDLRAPVRAIQGFTEIVLEMSRDEVGPSAATLLNRVVKAAVRMDSLIQDVLTLSHAIRRPIKLGAIDVNALVRSLVNERPELSHPNAEIKIDGTLHPMLGHEASLSQALTNLLANAVKFVVPGDLPRVRVWSEEVPPTLSAPAPAGNSHPTSTPRPTIRLWVEDQGIGISPNLIESIFEMFSRGHNSTSYEGSGIGLAVVRKALARMEGRVGVESEPSKGSRFWVELPKA